MAWSIAGNIRGPQGAQGPIGPAGETGPAGPAGPGGLNWQGAWDADTTYVPGDTVGWSGSTYFALDPGPAVGVQPTSGADDTVVNTGWALLAVEGATGPAGSTGPQGPIGETGPAGPTGPAGAAGAQGEVGPAGPEGPEGPAGPQGSVGPQGGTGATGARGSQWYTGVGAPGTIAGAVAGDQYLDTASGDVYTLS